VRNLSYDALNRLSTDTWVVGGSTVDTLSFTYDAKGNLLTASNNNGIYTFSYDALDRITNVSEPFSASLSFSYDAVGNRTVVHDSQGGATTSTYDADNRLTSRQFGASGQPSLRSKENRVIQDWF
jgi:YD repeat-containing protein